MEFVVYTEKYETKEQAQQRELQIKSWKSRIKIQDFLHLFSKFSHLGSGFYLYLLNCFH